jgi:succinyl-diaminopimelate desuccinylase
MKGALAVMIELIRDGAPFGALFFGREELPVTDSALTPLLERHPLAPELVVMMEPTDNALTRAAAGVTALAAHEPEAHAFDGLEFVEVASVTRIAGGIAGNVIPGEASAHVNFRYAPGRTPEEAEARLRELCDGHGELRIDANAPSGPVARGPLVDALIAAGGLEVAPKQAWTPVAEFGLAGLPAVNFGPGDPPQAHTRAESVSVAALVRSYRVLERFAQEALA